MNLCVFLTSPAGGIEGRTENYRQKLLNICAYAQLEPLGLAVDASAVPLPDLQSKGESSNALQKSLHTALWSLANERKQALRTAVKTLYGWTIGE